MSTERNRPQSSPKGRPRGLILARALLHKPKVLFLDEPTSGLDPSTALEIHRILKELRDEGMAIFLTTHNMEEATKLCDHVALLNEGVIVEYGTPEEICLKYNRSKNTGYSSPTARSTSSCRALILPDASAYG